MGKQNFRIYLGCFLALLNILGKHPHLPFFIYTETCIEVGEVNATKKFFRVLLEEEDGEDEEVKEPTNIIHVY